MEINYTDVYKEIDFISRELRKAIKHMPRYNRYNEGDFNNQYIIGCQDCCKTCL